MAQHMWALWLSEQLLARLLCWREPQDMKCYTMRHDGDAASRM
jgi:hypothetical protein